MDWDERRLERVLADLESRLAAQGIVPNSRIRWRLSTDIPTAAVTLGDDPEGLVNPEFLEAWCTDDAEAQVVLLHEWVHVLLGHPTRGTAVEPLRNLALDTVVNRVVARLLPGTGERFLDRLYGAEHGGYRLLRPMRDADRLEGGACAGDRGFHGVWEALDAGRIGSEDVHGYLESLALGGGVASGFGSCMGVG